MCIGATYLGGGGKLEKTAQIPDYVQLTYNTNLKIL